MNGNCQEKDCKNQINSLDPKRVYIYDEVIEDEVPVFICDPCYKKEKDIENDIDWDHAVED